MMETLTKEVARHLAELCGAFPDRSVCGPGNAAANDLFEAVVTSAGFAVESTWFDCLHWEPDDAWLEVGGERFSLHVGPYSHRCDCVAELAEADTIEALETGESRGKVLLLHGELAKSQLMPKGFPFFNPAEHRRIISAVERQRPAAVIAATGKDPGMAGAPYPFALFEDGDFDLPNAYLTDVAGRLLMSRVGMPASVRIESRRSFSSARQIVARRVGTGHGRIVIFAHIDTKYGTPGALDNASGVCILMALARILAGHHHDLPAVELVPLNGEDDYAVPGQMLWLEANKDRLDDVILGMNVDGAAHAGAWTSVSLYGCPPAIGSAIGSIIEEHVGFSHGARWPQGDHSLFTMNKVPAVAFTSGDAADLMATVIHTKSDTPELVDPKTCVDIARFMSEVISSVGSRHGRR